MKVINRIVIVLFLLPAFAICEVLNRMANGQLFQIKWGKMWRSIRTGAI